MAREGEERKKASEKKIGVGELSKKNACSKGLQANSRSWRNKTQRATNSERKAKRKKRTHRKKAGGKEHVERGASEKRGKKTEQRANKRNSSSTGGTTKRCHFSAH